MQTKNLKNIVRAISKVAEKNTVLPIIEEVMVKGNLMTVTDLHLYLTVKLPDDTLSGNYTLPVKELKDLVSTFKEIQVTGVSNNQVHLIGDGAELKIAGQDIGVFPKEPTIEVDSVGTLSQMDVAHLVMASKYLSKDELRPAMTWIAITKGHICATDARKLYFEPCAIKGYHMIHPKAVEVMNIFGGNWAMARNEHHIALTNGDVTMQFKELDEKFPDVFAVIPTNNSIEVAIATEELTATIKQAMKFANQATHQLVLGVNGALQVSAENLEFDKSYSKKLTKGYSKSGDDITIGFNGKFLLEILTNSDTKITTIAMSKPNRAAIINGNVLLMPILLDANA